MAPILKFLIFFLCFLATCSSHHQRSSIELAILKRSVSKSLHLPVVSGFPMTPGYLIQLAIGTPPQKMDLVLDTGSDLIWFQCLPCLDCYNQLSPIFNPDHSSSYASVPCTVPFCKELNSTALTSCNAKSQSCSYKTYYEDNSTTIGDLATETIIFDNGLHLPHVAVGCSHNSTISFSGFAGILGLGRGSLSLPSQALRMFGQGISLCLGDMITSSSIKSNLSSAVAPSLILGHAAIPSPSMRVAYTPMLQHTQLQSFYYVELTGVSLDGKLVASMKLNPLTRLGGAIIDCGSSATGLVEEAFKAVTTALVKWTSGFKVVHGLYFKYCFNFTGTPREEVYKQMPTMALHFAGGSIVPIPKKNYFFDRERDGGTYCVAIISTSDTSLIGNILLQGIRVVFDTQAARVGFMPDACH